MWSNFKPCKQFNQTKILQVVCTMLNRTKKRKCQCPSSNNLSAHPQLSSWKWGNSLVFKGALVYAHGLTAALQSRWAAVWDPVCSVSATQHISLPSARCGFAGTELGSTGSEVTGVSEQHLMAPKLLLSFPSGNWNKLRSHRGHSVSVGFTGWGRAEQLHPCQSLFPSISFGIFLF